MRLEVPTLVDLAPLDHGARSPQTRNASRQRAGPSSRRAPARSAGSCPARVPAAPRAGPRRHRSVLGRPLAQAQDALGAVFRDRQRHDHCLPGVLDAVDHHDREADPVEPAFGQRFHIGGGGPDEVAADAGLRHAKAVAGARIDLTRRRSPACSRPRTIRRKTKRRDAWRPATAAGRRSPAAAHPAHRCAAPGGRSIAIFWPARVAYAPAGGRTACGSAARPPLVSRAAGACDLILQQARGDQQAQLQGQTPSWGVTASAPGVLFAIQGQVDLPVREGTAWPADTDSGWPGFCESGVSSHRLASRRFLLSRGTHASSLKTGREEPPLLTFQLRLGHPPRSRR